MKLDDFYVASIVKYRRIVTLMQNFFVDMYGNNMKDTKFSDLELRKLLQETGFLSDAVFYSG